MTFVRQGVVRIDGWSRALGCAGVVAAVATLPLGASADAPTSPPARFRLSLTASQALPFDVRAAAEREIRQIWRREGIAVDIGSTAGDAAVDMRVLIVSAAAATATRDGHHWPVAELLGDGAGQPVAVVSIAAARRVLDAARLGDAPTTLVYRRLGIVIGRAIAHEVGHYLLNTAGHARHGLMRARIDARDFADLREGGFDLDDDAAQWARARLTRPPADALRLARFVYRP